jgi:beta-xylosidase
VLDRASSLLGSGNVVEAVMIWNEPNNLSHWDFEMDGGWSAFGQLATLAAQAVAAERAGLTRVLGGISPIDAGFIETMRRLDVLDHMDAVAIHGFPLDWNHWQIREWPERLAEIQSVVSQPVWITEVGVSTFGAEEVQEFGLDCTAQLLLGRAPRVHWYSLFDLPPAWPATTRHREAEGSSYYRHYYMGLIRADGQPKRAVAKFHHYTPHLGICQWFHFEDPRLDCAVSWLKRLGVRYVRTGLSWADSLRDGADAWFDRQMRALDDFDVTLTFCFTPESCGKRPHHTAPPVHPEQFAEFCARMVQRYA